MANIKQETHPMEGLTVCQPSEPDSQAGSTPVHPQFPRKGPIPPQSAFESQFQIKPFRTVFEHMAPEEKVDYCQAEINRLAAECHRLVLNSRQGQGTAYNDYEAQLKLLEYQNKKRLLLAKQEIAMRELLQQKGMQPPVSTEDYQRILHEYHRNKKTAFENDMQAFSGVQNAPASSLDQKALGLTTLHSNSYEHIKNQRDLVAAAACEDREKETQALRMEYPAEDHQKPQAFLTWEEQARAHIGVGAKDKLSPENHEKVRQIIMSKYDQVWGGKSRRQTANAPVIKTHQEQMREVREKMEKSQESFRALLQQRINARFPENPGAAKTAFECMSRISKARQSQTPIKPVNHALQDYEAQLAWLKQKRCSEQTQECERESKRVMTTASASNETAPPVSKNASISELCHCRQALKGYTHRCNDFLAPSITNLPLVQEVQRRAIELEQRKSKGLSFYIADLKAHLAWLEYEHQRSYERFERAELEPVTVSSSTKSPIGQYISEMEGLVKHSAVMRQRMLQAEKELEDQASIRCITHRSMPNAQPLIGIRPEGSGNPMTIPYRPKDIDSANKQSTLNGNTTVHSQERSSETHESPSQSKHCSLKDYEMQLKLLHQQCKCSMDRAKQAGPMKIQDMYALKQPALPGQQQAMVAQAQSHSTSQPFQPSPLPTANSKPTKTGGTMTETKTVNSKLKDQGNLQDVANKNQSSTVSCQPGPLSGTAQPVQPCTSKSYSSVMNMSPQQLQDYQMQLMLLEHQNKKRLRTLRQEECRDADQPVKLAPPQDHQMQLMLLEQESKKRLMKLRQEECRDADQPMGLAPPPTPTNNPAMQDYQMKLMLLEQQNKNRREQMSRADRSGEAGPALRIPPLSTLEDMHFRFLFRQKLDARVQERQKQEQQRAAVMARYQRQQAAVMAKPVTVQIKCRLQMKDGKGVEQGNAKEGNSTGMFEVPSKNVEQGEEASSVITDSDSEWSRVSTPEYDEDDFVVVQDVSVDRAELPFRPAPTGGAHGLS